MKLLVYLDTEDKAATRAQLDFVLRTHGECEAQDRLLLVEEVYCPRKAANEDMTTPAYLRRQPSNALESVKLLGPLCDVVKMELPGDIPIMGEGHCRHNLEQLDQAAARP